jgi:SPP1 family holin
MEKLQIEKSTITGTVVLVLALVNMILTNAGMNPVPFSADTLYVYGSDLFTMIMTIWAWWHNNSITQPALNADKSLAYYKEVQAREKAEPKV